MLQKKKESNMNYWLSICSQDIHLMISLKKNLTALKEIVKPGLQNCKYWEKLIGYSDINCKECGSHFSPCIASG